MSRQIEMMNIFLGFEQTNRYVICELYMDPCMFTFLSPIVYSK